MGEFTSSPILPTLTNQSSSIAPWVGVEHSGVTSLLAAQMLPNLALGYVDTVSRSLSTYVGPAIDSSLGFLGSWFASSAEPDPKVQEKRQYWQKEYGVSPEFLDEVFAATVQDGFQENAEGLNDEARLCLRRGGSWGECDDYEQFVKKLEELESSRKHDARLLVKIVFAEADAMIGERGKQYMETCWKRIADKTEDAPFDVIIQTIEGTDHDGVAGKMSVADDILRYAAGETATGT